MKVTVKNPLSLFAEQEMLDNTDAFYEAVELGRTSDQSITVESAVVLNTDGRLEATLTIPCGEDAKLPAIAQSIVARYRELVPDWEKHEAAREERRSEIEQVPKTD